MPALDEKIKITEEGESYDRKEIALAIRNSTYSEINLYYNRSHQCELCYQLFS